MDYPPNANKPVPAIAEANFKAGAPRRPMNLEVFDDTAPPPEGAAEALEDPVTGKLGLIGGVLMPCMLNIMGGISFLRLGWVVGQAGIWLALIILILSYTVTTITTLSLSAIATNGTVKGGGIYFLISRVLGPIWGTMLGLLWFIAQAFASSMYAVGVSEVIVDLTSNFGTVPYFTGTKLNDIRVVSILIILLLMGVAYLGMSFFAKTQGFLFVVMIVAILAVYVGSFFPAFPSRTDNYNLGFVGYSGWKNDMPAFQYDPTRPGTQYNFFTVFAVFFPAATGIMAGANVSGDLARPSVAIPKGTLLAVLFTFFLYVGLILVTGLACDRCVDTGFGQCPPNGSMATQDWAYAALANNTIPMGGLLYNKVIMATIVPIHPFFYFGVLSTSLSSALSCLVAAPRVLQSVARDQVIKSRMLAWLAVSNKSGEPMRALNFSFLFTVAVALVGNLDAIATLITMIFLASYAMVNVACLFGSITFTAGWRPSFKAYSTLLALIGTLECLGVMLLIDVTSAVVAFVLMFVVWKLVELLDPVVPWGAGNDAFKYLVAIRYADYLERLPKLSPKLFRANTLVMCGAPNKHPSLLKFAVMLRATKGAIFVGDVLVSSAAQKSKQRSGRANDRRSAKTGGGGGGIEDMLGKNGEETISFLGSDDDDDDGAHDDVGHNGNDVDEDDIVTVEVDNSLRHANTPKYFTAAVEQMRERKRLQDAFLNNRQNWGGKRCPNAFSLVVEARSLHEGFLSLARCAGIGKFRPNLALWGYPIFRSGTVKLREYEACLFHSFASDLSGVMVLRDDEGILNIRFPAPSVMRQLGSCFKRAAKKAVTKIGKKKKPKTTTTNAEVATKPGEVVPEEVEEASTTSNSKVEEKEGEGEDEEKQQQQPQPQTKPTEETKAVEEAEPEEEEETEGEDAEDEEAGLEGNRRDPNDMTEETLSLELPLSVEGQFVDVWWLADDGGLTALVPHILTRGEEFKGKKIRVFGLRSSKDASLEAAQQRLANCLFKMRIDAVTVVALDLSPPLPDELGTTPRSDAKANALIREFESKSSQSLSKRERDLTSYYYRVGEAIRKQVAREEGGRTAMCFVSCPFFVPAMPVGLYTVWMDLLSKSLPPTCLIYGSGEQVVTLEA